DREPVAGASMHSRQRPPASPAICMQTRRTARGQVGGCLPIPQLAYVEVALAALEVFASLPAEEDVACGLRDPLAADDPLAVLLELARAEVGLQNRSLRLLRLQHERIPAFPADKQKHPRARSHASNPDYLASHVHEPVGGEEEAPVGIETGGVLVQQLTY